jgi:hypothetical protein
LDRKKIGAPFFVSLEHNLYFSGAFFSSISERVPRLRPIPTPGRAGVAATAALVAPGGPEVSAVPINQVRAQCSTISAKNLFFSVPLFF